MFKNSSNILQVMKDFCDTSDNVGNARICAAVVYKGKIVSMAGNTRRTHPFQSLYSKNPEAIYWHAETKAIYLALQRIGSIELSKCSLVVARTKQSGHTRVFAMSKPCCGCSKCIVDFNLKNVYHTNEEGVLVCTK